MSFRLSTSGGSAMSFSRSGERTPLRSLQTDNVQTSNVIKSKSIVSSEPLHCTKVIVSLNDALKNVPVGVEATSSEEHLLYNPEELNIGQATQNPTDLTLKSFECEGGEVEISDELVEKADNTIPLPQPEICEHLRQSFDYSYISDTDDKREEETDHLYCRSNSASGEVLPEKTTDRLSDITLKGLNCTGGEIEIESSLTFEDTIPLPAFQSGHTDQSHIDLVHSTLLCEDHEEHPYCIAQEVDRFWIANGASVHEVLNETREHENISNDKSATFVSDEQSSQKPLTSNSVKDSEENSALDISHVKTEGMDVSVSVVMSPSLSTNQNANGQQRGEQKSRLDLSSMALPQHSPDDFATITAPSNPDVEMHGSKPGSQVHYGILPSLSSDATPDSALGLSANVLATEPSRAETLPEMFKAISECTPLQFQKCFTPIVRRASIAFMRARMGLVEDPMVDDDALSGGGSPERPGDDFKFWREHLDSPIPRPRFNSTELVRRSQTCVAKEMNKNCSPAEARVVKPVPDEPGMPDGTLQQQLRQMAEFLMMASGKMGQMSAATALAPQAEQHNACVGTSPMKMINHSVNTSGQFERKRTFSVVDQCTSTDPLVWSVGCLEGISRPELEQRVLSSMIIVEALVQQLAAAQAHTLPSTGAAPSELRERAVQTQHTELSQTSMHRELYLEALNRIQDLELDNASLQTVIQNIEIVKKNMTALTSVADSALRQMEGIGDVARDNHNCLVSDYAKMRSLLVKSRESQMRMIQKVKYALQQREDMRAHMEEALAAKDSTERVMDQLRKHCSVEISALEKCMGSQQELLSAFHKAQPEQAAFKKAYSETLNSTTELLSKTTAQQSSLAKELCRVRALMQRCSPLFLRLNEKAAEAVRERNQLLAERDRAVQDKEQTDEELSQTLQTLEAAKEKNSNFNLQVTILTSEMGVLRQKLSEGEEERAQLDRKATELSATVSSTLASYAFLEQALAVETSSLQESWADIKQAKDRVQELELSLAQSEQCVGELSKALGHSEEQLGQLQSVAQAQAQQLQQLQEECTQLREVCEENEFLLSENELTREQVTESERLLRANLQSLRERNIACEDLNAEVCQLQHANKNLLEELSSVRAQLDKSWTEHREKLEQMVIEIVLLHHTVRSMANELRTCLKEENPGQSSLHNIVSSSTVTLGEEREEDPSPDAAESGLVFSQCSAFTRITAVTPKRGSLKRSEEEELQTRVSSLLLGLDSAVTELQSTLSTVQQHKDAQLNQQKDTIWRLQRELEDAHNTHQTEASELQSELSLLQARMEKNKVALEQKAQVDKTVSKLLVDMNELQDMLAKQRADNSELRKEVVGLRRSLQQSKSESQVLHDELRNHTGLSAPDSMDEKIVLLKELEKLKTSLQAEEQAKNRLLERAKRHQSIYQTNQQKSEKELQMLSRMINKVRETLLSLPVSVKKCDELQQLIQYVG